MTGPAVTEHPFSLAGKKAVVIGGSAGIGRGIADLIAQLGGQVLSTPLTAVAMHARVSKCAHRLSRNISLWPNSKLDMCIFACDTGSNCQQYS